MTKITIIFIMSLLAFVSSALSADWNDLLSQADSLSNMHDYDSAIIIGNLALEKSRDNYGENDSATAWVLYRLGRYYLSLSDNPESNTYLARALDIQTKLFGKNHPDVAVSTYYLGATYLFMQKYNQADTLFSEAIKIKEAVYGKNHLETAKCLIGYISLKKTFGDYTEAERLTRWALAIFEQDAEGNKYDITKMLEILGDIAGSQGRTTEAIDFYNRALKLEKTIPNVDDAIIARNLSRTAFAYYLSGDYFRAGPLYDEAIILYKSRYGDNHSKVAVKYVDLGLLYQDKGDYIKAKKLYEEALEIYNLHEDENRLSITRCLHFLGNLFYNQNDFEQAEPMLQDAKEYALNWLPDDHFETAMINNSLADLYLEKRKYMTADSLFLEALQILDNSLGSKNQYLLRSLNGLGLSSAQQGRFGEARNYLSRAIDIENEIYGENNLQDAKSTEILGRCYRLEKDFENGLAYSLESFITISNNLNIMAEGMAEAKALLYAQFLRFATGSYLSCFFDKSQPEDEDLSEAASVIFASKGPVSDIILKRQRQYTQSDNPELTGLFDQLGNLKHDLANQFNAGSGVTDFENYDSRLDSLREQIEKTEEQIGRLSASFRNEKEVETAAPEKIRNSLPNGSVLIEYLRYNYIDLKDNQEKPHYMAVVMDNYNIQGIKDLGSADIIDSLVSLYRHHINKVAISGMKPSQDNLQEYFDISVLLYNKIFAPIVAEIDDSASLILSPDGSLNLISFASLPISEGKYLVEKYPIQYLSAGRDLIRFKNIEKSGTGLFALGDPDYDATVEKRTSMRKNKIFPKKSGTNRDRLRNFRGDCDNLRETNLSRLLGTRREVESIGKLWEKNFENRPDIFVDSEASEENFKKYSPGKKVIHLATHGYFISADCLEKENKSSTGFSESYIGENPLLYSGLFLAGANLKRKDNESLNTEDGILTAEEVSALNLSGCQWVVLSACESGLGELQTGEGVYGLRRAFQMAGARTVISSLWPVSDQTTAEMMKALYKKSDKTVPEILREMMLKRLRKLRKRHQPDHPVNWAAFISIGDWRGL